MANMQRYATHAPEVRVNKGVSAKLGQSVTAKRKALGILSPSVTPVVRARLEMPPVAPRHGVPLTGGRNKRTEEVRRERDSSSMRDVCKQRPDSEKRSRGSGGSKKWVPWCETVRRR